MLAVTEPTFRRQLTRRGLVHQLGPELRSLLLPDPHAAALIPSNVPLSPRAPASLPAATAAGDGSDAADEPPLEVVPPSEVTSALVQSRIQRSVAAIVDVVPSRSVLPAASIMTAVVLFALRQPRARSNVLRALRRAAISSAGGVAVALWVLLLVQRGVRSWSSPQSLAAMLARRSGQAGGASQAAGVLAQSLLALGRLQQWVVRHRDQLRQNAPITVVLGAVAVALWSARRRL